MQRVSTAALSIAFLTLSLADPAAAGHLVIEVSGPGEVIVGQELEISAVVRGASDGLPIEGATVVFIGDSFFAGVSGEIELGSTQTNNIGVATFGMSFSVRGVHRVRVEVSESGETQEAALIIGVDHGPQIVAAEAGVDIPGLGSWLVTFVIACVWAVMIVAAVRMARVSRSGKGQGDDVTGSPGEAEPQNVGRRRRSFNLATTATGAIILLSLGLVTLLIRSPETHHNFDPEGYSRSPVAYLDAAYVYPGPGLIDDDALTGDAIDDGRALFLKLGCAGCHGLDALGAASARSPAFATRQWLGTVVRTGLPGGMPAYSASDLNDADLDLMHAFLLDARDALADETPGNADGTGAASTTTTVADNAGSASTTTTLADGTGGPADFVEVEQILQANCSVCHGAAGGWAADDYESIIGSGDNGPAVIAGDPGGSILAQKLLGTQTFGTVMPPGGSLADSDIQLIIDWIAAGAAP